MLVLCSKVKYTCVLHTLCTNKVYLKAYKVHSMFNLLLYILEGYNKQNE